MFGRTFPRCKLSVCRSSWQLANLQGNRRKKKDMNLTQPALSGQGYVAVKDKFDVHEPVSGLACDLNRHCGLE